MSDSSPSPDLDRINRRRARRMRSLRSAKLIFGGFSPTVFDCVVVDLSEAGACVETAVAIMVPEVLKLRLSDNTDRRARRCWAIGNQIGLAFLPEAEG